MKVLVTGGTGFVGSHIVRCLLRHNETVVCLARPASRLDNLQALPISIATGDLKDSSSLYEAVKGCGMVYHSAADYRLWCPDPEEMLRINVDGTDRLMRACFEARVDRVVYTSTVGCLGKYENGTPADESTPVRLEDMQSPYKRTKFLAQQRVLEWAARGLPVVIVNPSTPIGEMDLKPTPTGKMIVDFLRGKMFGFVDTGMNLIDVRDVAEGHWQAAQRGLPGEKYILGNQNLRLQEIFALLAKMSGVPAPTLRVPYWVALAYARVENCWSGRLLQREPSAPLEGVRMSQNKMWFDSSKAIRELGLWQNPVENALMRAIQWFQENGYTRPK
ncbi:MAG: NAD-dependent epimerase/dehydratase family protein [Terriglobia bacterium]